MRNWFSVSWSVLILFSWFFAGCASLDSDSIDSFTRDSSDPPRWYTHPPQSDEYIYAVGWSGPTYRPSKSREQALERAVAMLAAQAEYYIKSEMVIRQDLGGVRYSDSLTESEIEGKVKGFTIVAEHRCFDDGKSKSPPGTTYILIRIPKSKLELH